MQPQGHLPQQVGPVGDLLANALMDIVRRAGRAASGAVVLPEASTLELEQAVLPREAFFAPAEHVPAERAAGRIAAEMVSPYPPGVPVIAPGAVITDDVLDYLGRGVDHGVLIPDAADPSVRTLRVVARR
ncbi:amino acid decarboxylase [Streptomyces sp. NPDC048751]|uniref:Orn/Lys/Arg family decarboxylase n=1 Tax=Streptomyces sp. NPDC048751 TaxID=3365591 RepID=UPI0037101CE3